MTTVLLVGVLALLVAEVVVLAFVGAQLGVLATVGLLLAGSLLGGWLVRWQGTRTWRAFAAAVAEGRPPGREVLDGVLVLAGGVLVLLPGFVSDVLGLLCLLPPTRKLLRGAVLGYATRRTGRALRVRSERGAGMPPQPPGGGPPRAVEGEILEGEVVDGGFTDPPAGRPRRP